jgi:hypothetical protein
MLNTMSAIEHALRYALSIMTALRKASITYPAAVLLALAAVAIVGGADLSALPEDARAALEPAIVETTARFNFAEDHLRENPRIERVGPEDAPYLMRAAYRQASPDHAVIAVETVPEPAVTVRIRASEIEKRATNNSTDGIEEAFAKAPWKKTPRGFLLDYRLRWTGAAWEQVGDPSVHASLGAEGAARAAQALGGKH